MDRNNKIGVLALAVIVFIVPLVIKNQYDIYLYTLIGLHCMIVIGLSLFMGYAGQISLGQAGFYAIGAYMTGLFSTRYGISPFFTIFLAILITAAAALLIGVPSLRLRGHYLAMATLGFGAVVYVIFDNAIGVTGGVQGITDIPPLRVLGYIFKKQVPKFYLTWGTLVLLMAFSLNIMKSRVGRACRAIHGNETAASVMGVNISKLKIQIFVLSALYASLAGSYYASFENYISPEPFSLEVSIHLVVLVAIGGMTNLWAALSGAIFLSLLFAYMEEQWLFFKENRILFDGAILILIMMFFPRGLFITLAEKFRELKLLKRVFKRRAVEVETAK